MTDPKSFVLSPAVHESLVDHSSALDDVRRRLIAETATLGAISGMQVAPEQSLLLTALTRLVRAREAVEIGTFTGLSSLSIALGLADGGHLLCCDVSEDWTAVARRAWVDAGVDERIELRIAPGADTLRSLPTRPYIDLAFIDADKPGYITYWEELVPRLRPGGVLLVDNVLWRGRVADPADSDEATVAIRAFNDHALADRRVDIVMLPVSDGLSLATRR